MLKHTEGPWEADGNDPAIKGEFAVFAPGNDPIHCVAVAFSPDDAHLIAAAPELLTAAKEYLEALDHYNAVDCPGTTRLERRDDARAALELAISKAEGTSK